MTTSAPVRGFKRWLKRVRYEWTDHSHGMPMITRVVMMTGGAVVVFMINYDRVWHYILGVVVIIFVLTQIPVWVKNWRYKRQCEKSGEGHDDEQWTLKQ